MWWDIVAMCFQSEESWLRVFRNVFLRHCYEDHGEHMMKGVRRGHF